MSLPIVVTQKKPLRICLFKVLAYRDAGDAL
jgi:hypothetical protein